MNDIKLLGLTQDSFECLYRMSSRYQLYILWILFSEKKLYSNLIISDPRRVSWWNSHAVHELKSQINLVQLLRINQDIPGAWSDFLLKAFTLFSFFTSTDPFASVCLLVFACVWISVCLTDKVKLGASEKWVRFHLRAHDWRPTSASPGVCCCWQESMAPCSLTESWHRFHSTAALSSHAIALLHQQ